MFCSPPLLLTPKDNQLLGMVVTCGPSLGPSRVGPPFLLSEPNTNYFLAAAPPPHVGRGVVVGRMGRPDTGVVRDTPHLCGHGWRPHLCPSMPFRLTGTPAPHPCSAFHFFFSPEIQGGRGVGGVSPVKGVPGRGGDRLSGILYSCSDNTNSGGNGREKTRPLKLLVV